MITIGQSSPTPKNHSMFLFFYVGLTDCDKHHVQYSRFSRRSLLRSVD
jgi:hypothetical protein